MGGLSWWHWLVIGGAFILLFGAKKLPDMARGVGQSLRILKTEVAATKEDPIASEPARPSRAAGSEAEASVTDKPAAAQHS